MKIDVLLGLQWGDEGKGKITDVLTPDYDVIARFQGGPNAGHTLEFNGEKHVLHTIPSGIFHPHKKNVIGNGVIIDLFSLAREIKNLRKYGVKPEENLFISKRAHMILPTHRLLDGVEEVAKGNYKIGSTLKGIGPTYTDKTGRLGLRIGDLAAADFQQRYDRLKAHHLRIIQSIYPEIALPRIENYTLEDYEKLWFDSIRYLDDIPKIDSEIYINQALKEGKKILAEGAQGTMLDVDFGTYPFVTSSNTITGGVCSGLGIAPQRIGKVYGIFKTYCTRVGSGPFPTELFDETGDRIREEGKEFGSTTGRPRRCGWIDLPALRYSVMLNGVTHLVMMKSDVLDTFESIKACTHYRVNKQDYDFPGYETLYQSIEPIYQEFKGWQVPLTNCKHTSDFPEAFNSYINTLGKELGLPVAIVSVGPQREQTVMTKYP
ncbi:MAG: adenylosuccinate synthase [Lentimicrobium sp.]|jgi:adenylosuccinate synthase|nr:adenylosuccinate synthase [Lentimicrobium sp.]